MTFGILGSPNGSMNNFVPFQGLLNSLSVEQFLDWEVGRKLCLPLSLLRHHCSWISWRWKSIICNSIRMKNDVWTYIWGSTSFTCKQAYSCLCGTLPASPYSIEFGNQELKTLTSFSSGLCSEIYRINTKGMLGRRNMHLGSYCWVLCVEQVEEDVMHLFYKCPFSQACWISSFWIFLGILPWIFKLCYSELEKVLVWLYLEKSSFCSCDLSVHIIIVLFLLSVPIFCYLEKKIIQGMKAVALRVKPKIRDKVNIWFSSIM